MGICFVLVALNLLVLNHWRYECFKEEQIAIRVVEALIIFIGLSVCCCSFFEEAAQFVLKVMINDYEVGVE